MISREQARQILALYRPWSADAQDPEFAEALALVERDAELQAWFEDHCAVQTELRQRIASIRAPAGLKEQIISEYRAGGGAKPLNRYIVTSLHRYIVRSLHRKPIQRFNDSTIQRFNVSTKLILAGAVAAVIVLGIGLFSIFGPTRAANDATLAGFQLRMAKTALRAYAMFQTDKPEAVQNYLAQNKAVADYELPVNLKQDSARGPRAALSGALALTWQGKPVSMICFRTGKPLPAGQLSDLYLFVIKQADLPNAPNNESPQFLPINRLSAAIWSKGGKTYLLAVEGTETELKKYIKDEL